MSGLLTAEKATESWKSYPSSSFYEVSDAGRVRSVDRLSPAKGGSKRLVKGRVLRQRIGPTGYFRVNLSVEGNARTVPVHVMVCETFHDDKPFEGAVVRHLDDVRTNNVAGNLAWGSQSDNMQDALLNGRNQEHRKADAVLENRTRSSPHRLVAARRL